MVSFRTVVLLAALASASAHTRGAAMQELNAAEDSVRGPEYFHRILGKNDKKKANKPVEIEDSSGKQNNSQQSKAKGKQKNPTNPSDPNGKNNNKNKNKDGNKNAASGDNRLVQENHVCKPFDSSEIKGRASMGLTDVACKDNTCGGGCCRVYHWLICDESNEMPQLSCVCNENTLPPPTSAPTDPPTPPPALPAPEVEETDPPPEPTEPKATEPAATEPAATEPEATEPEVTEPEPTEPEATEPEPTEPEPTEPEPTEPEGTEAETDAISAGQSQAGQNGEPPFWGVHQDSCINGSPHHANPLFKDFTKCFGANDCPGASECCIHSFCFCGEPDNWNNDCVAHAESGGK